MTDSDVVAKLRKIRTFAQLCTYFDDELGWPMDADGLDDESLDEITFDWDADELGIPADAVTKVARIRQLRPLTTSQPWGIFFVELRGERLLVTPLRRLLQALVTKKRNTGSGEQRSWDRDDLLFVVTTDSGSSVEMHLLAFFDSDSATPEIRSLPWRPIDAPDRQLRRLATELLPSLAWPESDDEAQPDVWREAWRKAFKLPVGYVISTADRLAERMAATATDLRTQIGDALRDERDKGPFTSLLDEVRRQLVAGVDNAKFADMCAQTLVYGVLSARVTDPDGFGASPVLTAVPLANPFLAAFFEQVHDHAVELDLEGSGLEQLVADLKASKVEAILDAFGSTAKGGDPVIHFYEEFLKRYDAKMRADAGAFYTPEPVVTFMTRTVDQILRDRFGLLLGVADASSWGEVCAHLGIDVPEGIEATKPFVSMLDPATGTGTFLVAWLRQAKSSFLAAHPTGDWSEHLRTHVLPAMHAFELMLGPYAIAHLKVALALDDDGLELADPHILLTDTLDYSAYDAKFEVMKDAIAVEGEAAAELKSGERFSVVIGNPPYDREQKDVGRGGKRKGGVVRYGVPGIPPLLEDITDAMSDAGLGVHIKNLYNDYVYFWRWATWQATQLPDGPGVVAFITAASYLDGVSMGGLREHLRSVFDELWIVDLGGDNLGALKEQNVFDITIPVAICFGVRTGATATEGCDVRYRRIHGDRQDKFEALNALSFDEQTADGIDGAKMDRFTPRSGVAYYDWPEITALLPLIFPGVKAGRTWVIGESKALLATRLEELIEAIPNARKGMFKDSPTGRKVAYRLGKTNMPGEWDHTPVRTMERRPQVKRYGYRSFDRQFVIADPRFLDRASSGWAVDGKRQLFLTTLTSTKLGHGPALTVSPYVPDLDHFSGRGAKNIMPLYRDKAGREPNVAYGLLDALGGVLGRDVTVEDLAAYLHGMLGTAAFSERFADELAEGAGPVHVPITAQPQLFDRAVALGRDLLWWHTFGERFAPAGARGLPDGPAVHVDPIHSYPEKYFYDPDTETLIVGTGTFAPVPEAVWSFEVSGLKPLQSWLGYRMAKRKGKKSSPLDDIRPTRWTFTDELLQVIAILDHTVNATPQAAEILDDILAGDLIDATDLPAPTPANRKPPKV